jgi:hypothetical protein
MEKLDNLIERPHMIADTHFHRWPHSQRLVNPTEIVMHVVKRNRVL